MRRRLALSPNRRRRDVKTEQERGEETIKCFQYVGIFFFSLRLYVLCNNGRPRFIVWKRVVVAQRQRQYEFKRGRQIDSIPTDSFMFIWCSVKASTRWILFYFFFVFLLTLFIYTSCLKRKADRKSIITIDVYKGDWRALWSCWSENISVFVDNYIDIYWSNCCQVHQEAHSLFWFEFRHFKLLNHHPTSSSTCYWQHPLGSVASFLLCSYHVMTFTQFYFVAILSPIEMITEFSIAICRQLEIEQADVRSPTSQPGQPATCFP